jgi:hypothetical protein
MIKLKNILSEDVDSTDSTNSTDLTYEVKTLTVSDVGIHLGVGTTTQTDRSKTRYNTWEWESNSWVTKANLNNLPNKVYRTKTWKLQRGHLRGTQIIIQADLPKKDVYKNTWTLYISSYLNHRLYPDYLADQTEFDAFNHWVTPEYKIKKPDAPANAVTKKDFEFLMPEGSQYEVTLEFESEVSGPLVSIFHVIKSIESNENCIGGARTWKPNAKFLFAECLFAPPKEDTTKSVSRISTKQEPIDMSEIFFKVIEYVSQPWDSELEAEWKKSYPNLSYIRDARSWGKNYYELVDYNYSDYEATRQQPITSDMKPATPVKRKSIDINKLTSDPTNFALYAF